MCQLSTQWTTEDLNNPIIYKGINNLDEMEKDGLVQRLPNQLIITEKGRPYIRNVCMCFDEYLWQKNPQSNIFSQTI